MRYEAMNAMLLNGFLEEHRKVTELEKVAGQQPEEIKMLAASVKDQNPRIEAMNDQLRERTPGAVKN